MSEGKYPRLPKPKDRSKGVRLSMGQMLLKPTHDKAGEWEEEGDNYVEKPKAKPAPESLLSKASRLARELGASATGSWASMMDDDEEKKP